MKRIRKIRREKNHYEICETDRFRLYIVIGNYLIILWGLKK
ncbi:hypothetical protein LCGC14_0355850 [marine sediment metagenome]|uniref:Uncharacterized protein n=1 Tax=marine sediment metagenome TaxID=412755 RepID=A0A0F9WHJ1_9ZZZZ